MSFLVANWLAKRPFFFGSCQVANVSAPAGIALPREYGGFECAEGNGGAKPQVAGIRIATLPLPAGGNPGGKAGEAQIG